ncbi:peptide ABC transporter permease [Actinoplanes lobatus]|uniref:Peptide ABC transporter permease n=1 Tax=Actinoplanes lobatus TaxID=113568 RepID=A0A7W7MH27_9ACTN|nr:ABC transporter substrate-binding protein [Actinoplanes lobatus]MBB4749913.1 peptide/nickel transport system substrate-binding protein [Actinoplanes lobatus]GGN95164.1 peptide ABC transporter permease [Actinoplanes lobatus]GIE45004.1 peptide ABC transporter permease [Actinoplanes lobatus]
MRRTKLAAFFIALTTLSGCAGGAAGSAEETPTLRWAVTLPAHWDPVVSGSGAQFRILSLAYASLTEINEKGEAVPSLAESWDYNDKGDQITFHLRKGLKFSDGEPVNAEAIKSYLERAKTQKDSALFGDLTSIETVTAKDLDVVVDLTQTDYQIPLLLGERVAQIPSPKAAADPAALDKNPVGAGPFVVTENVPGSHVYLKKNPDYWDAANIKIEKVELLSAPDTATIVSGVQTGVYDLAGLAPNQVKAAEAAKLDVVVQPGYNAANLSINVNKKPFDNPKVVDAIRYATNRQEFVDKVSFGIATPTDQPFPDTYLAYDSGSANRWPYDVAKAKALIAEAGYQPGDIKVDLVIPNQQTAAEIIQSQLAAIGITVNIKVDPNWATPFFAKDLALSIYGTTGRESPVQTLTAHFGPNGPLNLSTPYEPEGFEAAVKVARETPLDSADYQKNLQAATRAGLESRALVFTYSLPNLFVKSTRVSDFAPIPGQLHWAGLTVAP